ncbi:MAG: hypothetical protein ABGY96_30880 [bacterium]
MISSDSIPRKGSKAIKTDRIDALDLAQFSANDLLTIVWETPSIWYYGWCQIERAFTLW